MIDAAKLSDVICGNEEYLEKILYELGYENIKKTGNNFRFSNIGSKERNACIWIDDLHYENFSHAEKGNVFTLVMSTKNIRFPDALKWVQDILGVEAPKEKITLPFGGFYKKFLPHDSGGYTELKTYSKEDLPKRMGVSHMFFEDGVSYEVQENFGVSVDLESNRIIIPIEGPDASLIGAKWRANERNASQRYGTLLSYPKSQILYGFNRNYDAIQDKNAVMLVEAEKSVMQGCTFGIRNILACAGHQPSKEQIRLLQSLRVGTIIIGFDESIECEELEWNAKRIKSTFDTRVGFIFDKDNDVLKAGSKDSPTDHGKKVLKELLRNHVVWVR